MKSYAKWKERSFSVTSLLLDSLNPRLPIADKNLSQAELIEELVIHDDIYSLAKSIAEKGYYPVESLIGIQENGKKCILEGNRRLAALKLLISPAPAPETYQKRFKDLSDNIDPATIGKVKVLVAPSRKAAAPIINSRHTQPEIKRWSPIQQAKFYQQQLDRGVTVEQLSNEYAMSEPKVRAFLRSYTMYNIACHLDVPPDIQEKVHDPRVFPSSTLDRLYENLEVQKFLGIRFDNNKELIGEAKAEEFKKGYTKIVGDVAKGDVHSRIVNKTEDVRKYLAGFGDRKPRLTRKGSFTAADLIGGTVISTKKRSKKLDQKAKTPKQPVGLIPGHIKCTVRNQRIIDIFQELKKLKVAQFPNAVAIMFRSLLEMSVAYYLDHTGRLKEVISKERKRRKGNLPRNWAPTLKQMLKFMANDDTIELNPQALTALNQFISDKNNLLNADTLNFFVHNAFCCPTERELRPLWSKLEEVLKITLLEPKSD
ncbi:MAG: hypothetical protein KAV87_04010 [Desulfobacteraceae bacterium]|nr:hypothetical protein [Desulfobacteraceae bacterium]